MGVVALHIAFMGALQLWISPLPSTGRTDIDTVSVLLQSPTLDAAPSAPVRNRLVPKPRATKSYTSRPIAAAPKASPPVVQASLRDSAVVSTEPVPPISAASAPIAPLNLALSKQALANPAVQKGLLPPQLAPDAAGRQWRQFAKKVAPSEEIKEERLAEGGVRVRTKHGCYRVVPSATQRLDPYNWSPSYVTKSNVDVGKWCSD